MATEKQFLERASETDELNRFKVEMCTYICVGLETRAKKRASMHSVEQQVNEKSLALMHTRKSRGVPTQ